MILGVTLALEAIQNRTVPNYTENISYHHAETVTRALQILGHHQYLFIYLLKRKCVLRVDSST